MSTPAQIAANIANAQSSTGPRTATGKAASSKNGVTLGLFTASDFVRAGEESAYAELHAELLHDLAPAGVLERNLVDEIRRAMWRLRRCGEVEANLAVRFDEDENCVPDPMETSNPYVENIQKAVDRSRAQAHRLLHKSTAELRRLQTDRQFAKELLADADTPDIGLADWRAITKAHRPFMSGTRDSYNKKLNGPAPTLSIVPKPAGEANATPCTMRTQSSAAQTAESALSA